MTAQLPEILWWHGKCYEMCSEPLNAYFRQHGNQQVEFGMSSTSCWRGYIGTWEIRSNKLYLVSLSGLTKNGENVSIESIFPMETGPIFAGWFTGRIRLPDGRVKKYVHMGYDTIYERDMFLSLHCGVLMSVETIENSLLRRLIRHFLRLFKVN
jgi:hypothetical protein